MKRLYVLVLLTMGFGRSNLLFADADAQKRQPVIPFFMRNQQVLQQQAKYAEAQGIKNWLPAGDYSLTERNPYIDKYDGENTYLGCKNCSYDIEKDALSCDCTSRTSTKRSTVSGCVKKGQLISRYADWLVCTKDLEDSTSGEDD